MEDTLREQIFENVYNNSTSLNPCFNGRYSQSVYVSGKVCKVYVLILVLMEDTLRAFRAQR